MEQEKELKTNLWLLFFIICGMVFIALIVILCFWAFHTRNPTVEWIGKVEDESSTKDSNVNDIELKFEELSRSCSLSEVANDVPGGSEISDLKTAVQSPTQFAEVELHVHQNVGSTSSARTSFPSDECPASTSETHKPTSFSSITTPKNGRSCSSSDGDSDSATCPNEEKEEIAPKLEDTKQNTGDTSPDANYGDSSTGPNEEGEQIGSNSADTKLNIPEASLDTNDKERANVASTGPKEEEEKIESNSVDIKPNTPEASLVANDKENDIFSTTGSNEEE